MERWADGHLCGCCDIHVAGYRTHEEHVADARKRLSDADRQAASTQAHAEVKKQRVQELQRDLAGSCT